MSDEDIAEIEEFLDDGGDLNDAGWEIIDCETIIQGDIEIEEVDD
jgi:hypothetical protein